MSAFRGRADIARSMSSCLLLTQSGHGRLGIGAVQLDPSTPFSRTANPCCNCIVSRRSSERWQAMRRCNWPLSARAAKRGDAGVGVSQDQTNGPGKLLLSAPWPVQTTHDQLMVLGQTWPARSISSDPMAVPKQWRAYREQSYDQDHT
jgi:hypothetical protein